MKKKGKFDFYFFLIVMSLLFMGLVMVFSASSEYARNAEFTGHNAYYFIRQQSIFAALGFIVMIGLAFFDYHKLAKYASLIMLGAILLLVAVLGVGETINGAKRWINLGFTTFEPSEFAKVAVIIFFSWSISVNQKNMKNIKQGIFPYLGILGVIAILLLFQPHMSATVLITAVGVALIFIGGANWKFLAGCGSGAAALLFALVMSSDYRRARFTTFLNPFADKRGDGYQIVQSLYAIGSGGLFGLGLGQSRQKFSYIPEPHNDFIFAILCEETGFVGAAFVILMFTLLIFFGIRIAINAPDMFGSLMAAGITVLIGLEVVINIAVVTSSIPVTGMPLPFFSYGGTALVSVMACMGIMLNISYQGSSKKM